MKDPVFPIVSAEKGTTRGPFMECEPIYRTRFFFTLGGLTAHAIEQAQRASFYGIHGNTPEAAQARRATQEAIRGWMNGNAPAWTAYYIESAQAMPTTGRDGYRATVTVTVTADHLTREI